MRSFYIPRIFLHFTCKLLPCVTRLLYRSRYLSRCSRNLNFSPPETCAKLYDTGSAYLMKRSPCQIYASIFILTCKFRSMQWRVILFECLWRTASPCTPQPRSGTWYIYTKGWHRQWQLWLRVREC